MNTWTIGMVCLFFCFSLRSTAQDTIWFEGKTPLQVDIIEERDGEVLYKKFNTPKSPTYILRKRFISEVAYQDPEARKLKYKPSTNDRSNDLEVWVNKMDGISKAHGLLHQLNDTTMLLRKKTIMQAGNSNINPDIVFLYPYQNIRSIEYRKRKKMRRYALWGAAGGFLVGTLTGLAIFEDTKPCDPNLPDGPKCDESLSSPRSKLEKSLTLGFASGGAGFLAGGMIGSVKVRIPIGGSRDRYNQAIPRLEREQDRQRKR